MYENPSAGKFDPPPAPKDPLARKPPHKRWWFIALLFVTGYPMSHWLFSRWARERFGWVAPVIALLALAVHFGLRRRQSEERGDNPYSPPTSITH